MKETLVTFPETCAFCGDRYHPMMRWAKKKQVTVTLGGKPVYDYVGLRTVCHREKCKARARAWGLHPQREITPSR